MVGTPVPSVSAKIEIAAIRPGGGGDDAQVGDAQRPLGAARRCGAPAGVRQVEQGIEHQGRVGADALQRQLDEPTAQLSGADQARHLQGALGAGRLAALLPFGHGLLCDVESAGELLLGEFELSAQVFDFTREIFHCDCA